MGAVAVGIPRGADPGLDGVLYRGADLFRRQPAADLRWRDPDGRAQPALRLLADIAAQPAPLGLSPDLPLAVSAVRDAPAGRLAGGLPAERVRRGPRGGLALCRSWPAALDRRVLPRAVPGGAVQRA